MACGAFWVVGYDSWYAAAFSAVAPIVWITKVPSPNVWVTLAAGTTVFTLAAIGLSLWRPGSGLCSGIAHLGVVLYFAAGQVGYLDRCSTHPLDILLGRCAGKWQIESGSAMRYPQYARGRESLEIEITDELETPAGGLWHTGATYGAGVVSFNGQPVPVELVMAWRAGTGPFARYRAAISSASDVNPEGFGFTMLVAELTRDTDDSTDWLCVDYRSKQDEQSQLILPDDLVVYRRVQQ
jgi:hypothetical protein